MSEFFKRLYLRKRCFGRALFSLYLYRVVYSTTHCHRFQRWYRMNDCVWVLFPPCWHPTNTLDKKKTLLIFSRLFYEIQSVEWKFYNIHDTTPGKSPSLYAPESVCNVSIQSQNPNFQDTILLKLQIFVYFFWRS